MVIKKITSIILAASTFATFALAGATVEASTEDPTIKHVGKTTQQDGILTAYNYNVSSNSKASVKVYKSDKDYTTIKFADFLRTSRNRQNIYDGSNDRAICLYG